MAVSPNPNVAEVLQGDSQAYGSSSLSRNGTEGEPELRTFVTALSLKLRNTSLCGPFQLSVRVGTSHYASMLC